MPPASRPAAARPSRRDWLPVAAATLLGGFLLERLAMPSAYLLAGIAVGCARALLRRDGLHLPEPAFAAGQAVAGVTIGAAISAAAFASLGADWLPVVLVTAATLGLTIAAGLQLGRLVEIDAPTASLGMVAGGASGIVAMARDLGADERIVAFMQYQRVLIVTVATLLLAPLAFGVGAPDAGAEAAALGTATGWPLTIAAVAVGLPTATRLRFPAPALLGPLCVAGGLALAGLLDARSVPALLADGAFALIGLRIGLGFDLATMRRIAGLLLPSSLLMLAVLALCAGLGWALSLATGEPLLDGYLASTPGGLYAVLPIAYGAGANTTFVLGVQTLRLLAMILLAPALVSRLHRPRRADRAPRPAVGSRRGPTRRRRSRSRRR